MSSVFNTHTCIRVRKDYKIGIVDTFLDKKRQMFTNVMLKIWE